MCTSGPKIAIVWHSRTGTAEAMASACAEGAEESAVLLRADEADAEILLKCDAFVFACPENLASMSGAMKEMFDRNYYALLGQVDGKRYSYIVAGGSDGAGTQRQIERICTGWRLRKVAEPILYLTGAQTADAIWASKTVEPSVLQECRDLGAAMANGLQLGIF